MFFLFIFIIFWICSWSGSGGSLPNENPCSSISISFPSRFILNFLYVVISLKGLKNPLNFKSLSLFSSSITPANFYKSVNSLFIISSSFSFKSLFFFFYSTINAKQKTIMHPAKTYIMKDDNLISFDEEQNLLLPHS